MDSSRQTLGRWGESQAADFLQRKVYTILERNFHSAYGEIDLIAKCQEALVFVEVKTRPSDAFGMPEISVTKRKQEHLIASAQSYLQEKSDFDIDWQIDVIAIRKRDRKPPPEIIHFENAIT
jgi:putative endonuclease